MHLQRLVVHIAGDLGLGLQLQQFGSVHRPHHLAIDDHMVGMHRPLHARRLGNHQDAGLLRTRTDVPHHLAINAHAFGKVHISLDPGALGDQAFDRRLLLAGKHG